MSNPDDLLTLEEVCQILRVKPSWCYNNKTLPWVKVGKLKRLKRASLTEYIENSTMHPTVRIMRREAIEVFD